MKGHNKHANDSDVTTRTTITIPEDLKAQVETMASTQGISISATVVQIIRQYFTQEKKVAKCGQEQTQLLTQIKLFLEKVDLKIILML